MVQAEVLKTYAGDEGFKHAGDKIIVSVQRFKQLQARRADQGRFEQLVRK